MQVLFETRDPRGADLRDLAVHRVRFALRRLSWLVPRAEARALAGRRAVTDAWIHVHAALPQRRLPGLR